MALVVRFDYFPTRTLPGAKDALGMPVMIEVVMLTVFECFVSNAYVSRGNDDTMKDFRLIINYELDLL